jgi:tetratricopeptide (TPR) repeat protein
LPALLVITHRPEFTSKWSLRGFVTELHLNRLSRRDGLEIINAVAGANELPEGVAREILAKTDGIALFVEELTKAVIEAGSVVDDTALPTTLQGSLLARLDLLGNNAKHVAQVGAVIGREFRHSLLAAVAERPSPSISEGIARLIESGLLFCTENSKDPLYTFKHALVRDAAYESLLHARRSALHSEIVNELERAVASPQEQSVELVAYHAQHGGQVDKAITYSRLAGERANDRSAYSEALEHLDRALRLGVPSPNLQQPSRDRLSILLAMRPCLGALGDYERMLAVLSEAREVASSLGEHELALMAAMNRVHALYICGQINTAVEEGESALVEAESLGEPRFLLSANILLGIARHFRGELDSALDIMLPHVPELCDAYRHDRLETTGTSSVNWLSNLGAVHALLGDFESALDVIETADEIASETDKPFDRAMASWWYGQVLQLGGRSAEAVERLEATIALTEEHRMLYLGQWARKALGSAYVDLGEVDRGHDELARSLHDATKLGVSLSTIWSGSELAHAATELGDFRSAIMNAETARLAASRSGSWWMEGLAAQRLARAYALSGETRESLTESNWLAALELFERCKAEPLIAHCDRELGEFYKARGREGEARARFSSALTRYQRLHVDRWIALAETDLASLPAF